MAHLFTYFFLLHIRVFSSRRSTYSLVFGLRKSLVKSEESDGEKKKEGIESVII